MFSGLDHGTFGGVIEYRANLIQSDPLKYFDKLVNRDAVFQVFKQCRNGHPAVAKCPSTAKSVWVAPGGVASRPIKHHGTSYVNNSIAGPRSLAYSAGRNFFTSASLGWYFAPSKNT